MPVRLVNRMDMSLEEEYYREKLIRENMGGYYNPRYDHEVYMHDYLRQDRRAAIAQNQIEDCSSTGKEKNGSRGYNRQLPVPNQF